MKLYFVNAVNNDKLLISQNILTKLNDPLTKLFLYFLEYVLPVFNNLNKEMQGTQPQIYCLRKKVVNAFKCLLECFIQSSVLKSTPLHEIDFENPHNFVPLEEVYLGAKISMFLVKDNQLNSEQKHILFVRCLNFYKEGAKQISKRFDFNSAVLQSLEAIDPAVVQSKTIKSIMNLASHFPNLVPECNLQTLDSEWRLLLNSDIEFDMSISSRNIENFWKLVAQMKYSDETLMWKEFFPKSIY